MGSNVAKGMPYVFEKRKEQSHEQVSQPSSSRVRQRPAPKPKIFTGKPEVLALYCSDYRTREVVNTFLTETFPNKGVDLIALPGGVWWIASLSQRMKFTVMSLFAGRTKFIQKVFSFLVKNHQLREIVLLGHQDCGWYKKQYPNFSQKQIIEQIGEDLIEAREQLKEIFGNEVTTKGFIVLFDEAGVISFKEIY